MKMTCKYVSTENFYSSGCNDAFIVLWWKLLNRFFFKYTIFLSLFSLLGDFYECKLVFFSTLASCVWKPMCLKKIQLYVADTASKKDFNKYWHFKCFMFICIYFWRIDIMMNSDSFEITDFGIMIFIWFYSFEFLNVWCDWF